MRHVVVIMLAVVAVGCAPPIGPLDSRTDTKYDYLTRGGDEAMAKKSTKTDAMRAQREAQATARSKKAAPKTKLDFHEIANAWPLIEGEDFAQLVADIKANGLLEPIVLHEGKILDGRNRYRACIEAKVDVRTVEWDGECGSPEAYVLSRETRRHSTKGQQAMGVAKLYPEPATGGRGKKLFPQETFSRATLSKARFVLHHAPDLVEPVLVGATPLNTAYDEAKAREEAATSDQKRLAVLRATNPDLATKVEEGELVISDAQELAELPEDYRQRAMAGHIKIAEARALVERDLRERKEAVSRAAATLATFVQTYKAAKNMRANALRDDVLDALDAFDRKEFLKIEEEAWPATSAPTVDEA